MCGISGIISQRPDSELRRKIESMNALVRHRGPDDEGFFVSDNLALGHRRLAIIDLSARGHQPMCYRDRYWITYNGEVYNYPEIREQLAVLGCRFETATDTEVILAAYATWGEDCLRRFNGMWAFAIYDAKEGTVFMARDRFGVKPFHYAETAVAFAFGSEIKQLLPLQPVVRANRRMLVEAMLTYLDGHTEETYFRGVKSLLPGHTLTYRLATHSYTVKRWYQLRCNPDVGRLSYAEAAERFAVTFSDAVKIRLRSDVIVGTCLSGGLDSSATSAVAAAMYTKAAGRRFAAVHARSIDKATDESQHARSVAQHLDLELHEVEPTTEDFANTTDEVVYTQEEPFGSPSMFMGWHVFKEARLRGCKVMLNGQGGDEVLLGYERYFAAFLRAVNPLRFVRELFLQSRHSSVRPTELLLYLLYFTNADLRIRRLKSRSLLLPQIKDAHDFEYIRRSARSFRKLDELQLFEIGTLQLPHLLRYEDRNSMRHSVETRLPFLDYRLVELGVSIAPDYKIRDGWTKYVLRKGVEPMLPRDIVWRRDKLGFQAPDRIWLKARMRQMKAEVAASRILAEIADRNLLLDRFERLSHKEQWSYFNLAAWERIYKVQW